MVEFLKDCSDEFKEALYKIRTSDISLDERLTRFNKILKKFQKQGKLRIIEYSYVTVSVGSSRGIYKK